MEGKRACVLSCILESLLQSDMCLLPHLVCLRFSSSCLAVRQAAAKCCGYSLVPTSPLFPGWKKWRKNAPEGSKNKRSAKTKVHFTNLQVFLFT